MINTIKITLYTQFHPINDELFGLILDSGFLPTVNGRMVNETYFVYIRFYLGFVGKEETIIPVIEFNKSMIDFIERI